jgi:hypothetical protein
MARLARARFLTPSGSGLCSAAVEMMLIFAEAWSESGLPRSDADEHDPKDGLVVQKITRPP